VEGQYFAAFAALAGSAIGGLTLLASSWLSQNAQYRADELAHNKTRREELYKDFIEEASRVYADALQHDQAEVVKFVKLYALIGTMRVLSSSKVVDAAERLAEISLKTYDAPNTSLLSASILSNALDPFREFSEVCREELRSRGPLLQITQLRR